MFVNKTNYRSHVKNVHKNLSNEETRKFLEYITTVKPKFRTEDQIENEKESEEEVVQKKRTRRKLKS